MKDSTRANLYGLLIAVPFLLSCLVVFWLQPFAITFTDNLSLILPLSVGALLSYIAYRNDRRFKHYFREQWRVIKEFDENYKYTPEEGLV